MSDEKKPTPPSSGGGSCAPGKKLPCESESNEARIVKVGNNPNTHSATVITAVEVSNLETTTDLPGGFTDVSNDPDNFNIQIYDGGESGATIAKARTVVEMFKPGATPTAFNPPRKLEVELGKVSGKDHLYRSRYLRLVVDEVDQAAKPDQTILADWDPSDPTVEILGQVMRVTYTAADGTTKVSEATVGGPQRSWIRTAVHVVKGSGITVADATTRMRKWYRRLYAQISMAPQLLQVHEVDPVENLVSIGNPNGANATGGAGSSIQFTIRSKKAGSPDKTQVIGPHTPAAGAAPSTTAQNIMALIQANPDFNVRAVSNPKLNGTHPNGSVDLIITDPAGGKVTIEGLVQTDATQQVKVGSCTATGTVDGYTGTNGSWIVATADMRALLHAYDTGDDRIDIFAIRGFSVASARGESLVPGKFSPADQQAISKVIYSTFVRLDAMDGSDNNPFSLPHESGHDLNDANHITGNPTQMMRGGGTSGTNAVNASKRISADSVTFDFPASSFVQETRIRAGATAVLGPFP